LATRRKPTGSKTPSSSKRPAAPVKKKVAPAAKPAPASKAPKAPSKPSKKAPKKGDGERGSDERVRKLALVIAEAGLENKALNVEIIDVRGKVDYSDFVVVMSGRSDRQVNALGRNIEETVSEKHGARCLGVEGMPQGTWLLMDYGDVVVHIFHEDTRGYYDLETLWIDAARIPVEG
jgi:ribosome-associated protein